jgi:hypothetical protein
LEQEAFGQVVVLFNYFSISIIYLYDLPVLVRRSSRVRSNAKVRV